MANWYDNVPAPVDSNGREVPLDTRELVYGGETRSVLRIAYSVDLGRWMAELAETSEHPLISACTLPDSWERLKEDVAKDPCVYFGCGDDRSPTSCNSVMACDIIRRAKALAGVAD